MPSGKARAVVQLPASLPRSLPAPDLCVRACVCVFCCASFWQIHSHDVFLGIGEHRTTTPPVGCNAWKEGFRDCRGVRKVKLFLGFTCGWRVQWVKPTAKAAAESAEPVADQLVEGLQAGAKTVSENAERIVVDAGNQYVKPLAKVGLSLFYKAALGCTAVEHAFHM